MSDYTIEISSKSRVVVFQGTLKKAPQLNKRGRKKWKDRYVVLRANKMFECYKTKKALDSSKNPRKALDLRECINLEVGLEYKDVQHIISIGTFKRTFFFAAPSDALMLQWIDNMEKVKNAGDGEQIKILDIGMRRSPVRTIPTVPSMPSSQSLSRIANLCSSNASLPSLGHSGSSHALVSYTRPYYHVLASRDLERAPSLPPRSQDSDSAPSYSLSTRFDDGRRVSKSSPSSPQHATSLTFSQTQAGAHKTQYVNVSPRPPPGAKKAGTTQSRLQETQRSPTRGSHPQQKSSTAIPPPSITSRPRKGSLGALTTMEINPQRPGDLGHTLCSLDPTQKLAPPLGMKKSSHYRKINLKREKVMKREILHQQTPELSSDDEESEREWQESTPSKPLYRKKNWAKSSPNLSEIGRVGKNRGMIQPSSTDPSPEHAHFQPHSRYRIGSYSKVTVVGVKVQNCPSHGTLDGSLDGLDLESMDEVVFDSSPPPPPIDTDSLPERYPSVLVCDAVSVNSLDAILVDPPAMFDGEQEDNKETKRGKSSSDGTKAISGEQQEGSNSRNSTESCDTGYNSSPSYHTKTESGSGWISESVGSTSSVKHCVPMVFYTKNVWKPKGAGKGLIGLQVCLVEQDDALLQELLAIKELEGYRTVECEVEKGCGTVTTPTSDTLTVETSLEDLEFGFSVAKSTEKDMFERKVRVFYFEIKNLFDNNKKPFSCDVHIKHASELIVLPVELN